MQSLKFLEVLLPGNDLQAFLGLFDHSSLEVLQIQLNDEGTPPQGANATTLVVEFRFPFPRLRRLELKSFNRRTRPPTALGWP